MGKCKDCKFWEKDLKHDKGMRSFGKCGSEKIDELIERDDRYVLGTREDFGCIFFEEKP